MAAKSNNHVLSFLLNRETPAIVDSDGIYLIDDKGNRIIDASGGAIVCSIGHGVHEIAETVSEQMKRVAFVFRRAFHTPELEEAAAKICGDREAGAGRVWAADAARREKPRGG